MPKKTSKGKKKNGKSKKGSKSGSAGTDANRVTPEQRHKQFVEKLNTWLRANCGQLIDALHEHDPKGAGWVPKETFRQALLVVRAPLAPDELHILLKFLSNTHEQIDYLAFAKGLKMPFPGVEEAPCEDIKLNVRDISNPPCAKCKLKFPPTERKEIRPRYIQLKLELLQFVERELPCNFTLTVSDSLSVFGVKQIIQDKFGHSLVDLNIYPDKAVNETLPNACSLSELGFKGHTEDEPTVVTLFYDVHLHTDLAQQFYACPLLLTDHYFAKHEPKQAVTS